MSEHTPGPWFAQESIRDGWYICARNVEHIVVDSHDVGGFYGAIIKDADARLIAAAPELLEALENLLKVHEGEGGTQRHAGDIARAAIAKAKGK
jgi:hypothetical protein